MATLAWTGLVRVFCGSRRGSVGARPDGPGEAGIAGTDENDRPMPLQRIAWLVTVAALLIGALIMLLSHYQGYAALFAAVALSAAVNLR